LQFASGRAVRRRVFHGLDLRSGPMRTAANSSSLSSSESKIGA
jgi:hypothetical protein